MTVPLYMDVHVHAGITRGLRERGVDVLTAQEDGTAELPDPELLDRATELGRLLFSQDADLLREAAFRQTEGLAFSGVVFARQLAVPVGRCIEDLELIALAGKAEEFAGRLEYLPFR